MVGLSSQQLKQADKENKLDLTHSSQSHINMVSLESEQLVHK